MFKLRKTKTEEALTETPVTESVEEVAPVEVEEDDRSSYNCPDCKGDGIVGNVICNRCQGTGKV